MNEKLVFLFVFLFINPLHSMTYQRLFTFFACFTLSMAFLEAKTAKTAAGHPAEGKLEAFLGEPEIELKKIINGNRFPNVVVAVDGSVLAVWNGVIVKRSEDGGNTWGPEISIGKGFMCGGVTVNERNGDVFAFVEKHHPPADLTVYKSKDHGKSWEAVYEREHPPGFRWLHESFGTNWRMTELQAVIGRIQLRRMADWTAARTRNAERIWNTCRAFDVVRVPSFPADCVHAHYKCYVQVVPERLAAGWTRDRIIEAIVAEGVPCFQGSCSEVYLEKAFDDTGWRPAERLPVARELGETSLMFLVHPTLTEAEMNKICAVIDQVLAQAGHS